MHSSTRIVGVAMMLVCAGATALIARQAASPRPAAAAAKTAVPATKAAAAPAAPKPKYATPPLNSTGYALARPIGITRTVYDFVAQHPEVSRYVPCFCGCEADGHRANEMCFVKRRDPNGNVLEWDTHGFGCAVCVDVARESMQLFNSGADTAAIRAAIERKWAPQYHTHTPTPPVPKKP